MDTRGYSTVETALTFPLFLLLTVVLLYVLVVYVKPKNSETRDYKTFVERVYTTDSVKRKAEIINGIFE